MPTRHEEQTVADAAEYLPAAQFPVTNVSPVVAQYDPAKQAVHALDPVDATYVPVRQDEHTVADAAEYFPVAQRPVTAVSPVVEQYEPALQSLHADKPEVAANEPVEQLEQVVDELEAEYFPTRHDEQTVADAAEYFPAAQAPVTAESPVVAQ